MSLEKVYLFTRRACRCDSFIIAAHASLCRCSVRERINKFIVGNANKITSSIHIEGLAFECNPQSPWAKILYAVDSENTNARDGIPIELIICDWLEVGVLYVRLRFVYRSVLLIATLICYVQCHQFSLPAVSFFNWIATLQLQTDIQELWCAERISLSCFFFQLIYASKHSFMQMQW